jgi:dTDP-D-glucose 4,6-dehydratase
VGRSLTDILALPGLSLAGTSGDAGHPAQPDAIARIADIVSQKVEVTRNRIKAAAQADKITADERRERLARLSDMSAYDRLHLTEMMAMLNANVTGPVTGVEIVEKAWQQADKATYQNTFLKLSFGSVEEAGDDEDCVCNDNDDFDLATDEQYAAIAAELEFAPFEG